jgi:hypothetical protein
MPRSMIVAAALAALLSGGAQATTRCDEDCLLSVAGTYMDALGANDPSTVPFSPTLKSTENGAALAPGEGIWRSATGWLYRHTIVDPDSGGIAIYGTVTEGAGKRAILAARLKVAGGKIAESELLVSREGDFSLFNPLVGDALPILTRVEPVESRSTRAELAAIARSYFDGITHASAANVRFHPDCNRVENGVQTTNNANGAPSCAEGMPRFGYMQRYRELRMPVIDTRRGLVWAITAFDLPVMRATKTIRGKPYEINPERQHLPRTLFLYELFKVERGRIRAIEAELRNAPLGATMGWAGTADTAKP